MGPNERRLWGEIMAGVHAMKGKGYVCDVETYGDEFKVWYRDGDSPTRTIRSNAFINDIASLSDCHMAIQRVLGGYE